MARIVPIFNIEYIDYYVLDPRPCSGSWRTIVAFSSPEEAQEAAKVLAEKLRLHNPSITVFKNKVIIKKYVLEWKIYRALGD